MYIKLPSPAAAIFSFHTMLIFGFAVSALGEPSLLNGCPQRYAALITAVCWSYPSGQGRNRGIGPSSKYSSHLSPTHFLMFTRTCLLEHMSNTISKCVVNPKGRCSLILPALPSPSAPARSHGFRMSRVPCCDACDLQCTMHNFLRWICLS